MSISYFIPVLFFLSMCVSLNFLPIDINISVMAQNTTVNNNATDPPPATLADIVYSVQAVETAITLVHSDLSQDSVIDNNLKALNIQISALIAVITAELSLLNAAAWIIAANTAKDPSTINPPPSVLNNIRKFKSSDNTMNTPTTNTNTNNTSSSGVQSSPPGPPPPGAGPPTQLRSFP